MMLSITKTSRLLFILTLSLLLVLNISTKSLYDPVKSYVTIYNKKNFDSQITNNRQKGISIVHFYKESGKLTHTKTI